MEYWRSLKHWLGDHGLHAVRKRQSKLGEPTRFVPSIGQTQGACMGHLALWLHNSKLLDVTLLFA